jgi:CheY-like chemotaxis protein
MRNEPTPPPSQEGKSEIRNLKFEISDTGPGIAPEEMDTLFDAFIQTESGRKTEEGTGLGLALSRQFARLMGGDIAVTSQVGQGAIFTLTIQVELTEASDIHIQQPTHRVIGLEPDQCALDGSPYRILVVDNHHESRSLLRALLEQVGFVVREATNGQEAIEQYKHWQPHLIWMDMRMPVMDGYTATRKIRNSKDRTAILAAGCDDFLSKPFRDANIFDMMHKHLGVQFIYEESQKSKVENRKSKVRGVLMPESLAALPPVLLTRLEQATDRGDIQAIFAIIDEIRAHDAAVADALVSLANEFNYDKILRLIQDVKT